MPELPEVETVRRQLGQSLLGLRFVSVERIESAMLLDCTPEQIRAELPGRVVEEVARKGKFLVLVLTEDAYLTLHLGMTGHLLVARELGSGEAVQRGTGGTGAGRTGKSQAAGAEVSDPHSRFLFSLRSRAEEAADRHEQAAPSVWLEFRDMRKFGRVQLSFGSPAPRLARLGPDAWKGAWDVDYLRVRFGGRRAPLKALLLDQSILAGIGNIYADEILWAAQLSPLRLAGTLTLEELSRVASEIPRRLEEGVRLLGCSISDFVDTDGRAGGFQGTLKAYGRQGQTCGRCGQTMVRVIVAGRGTAFCPGCQF